MINALKQAALATKGLTKKNIEIDNQVYDIYVKPLSWKEVADLNVTNEQNLLQAMPSLLAKAVCDEAGTPIFTEEEIDQLSFDFVKQLTEAAQEVLMGKPHSTK